MGKTILELNASEAVITNPENYYFETHKQGDATSKKTVLTKITTYFATLFQEKFNASNTATGTTSVTINAKSGVATFNATVVAGEDPISFVINNNLVTPNTKILYSINYSPNDVEVLLLLNYNCSNGVINFQLYCLTNTGDANQPKQIAFQILN